MYLIPMPKSYKKTTNKFNIERGTEISIGHNCDFNELEAAIILQKEIESIFGFKIPINKCFEESYKRGTIRFTRKNSLKNEAYEILVENDCIEIKGAKGSGIFYGVQTLIQLIRQEGATISGILIEDEPYFKNRGYYHDVTRGKVPTLDTLKELVDRASFYKINQIQLYIEHTFAFEGMSEVWIDKDPLTAEEILLLDEYCRRRHVELIPSLSTFGHLYEVLRTESYGDLCELENSKDIEYSFIDRMAHHTLNVSDEKSFELVSNMINQFIPLFSSNKFNICCDETFDLGKGKSNELREKLGVGKLYTTFLNKVISLVKKHNKKVFFWGDVILNHPELMSDIPKDVICLNWNYWYKAKEDDTKKISESGLEQYVCPGVGGWSHLMNLMENGFENINRMVSYGVKYGAIGVLNTDWGDYGHINLLSNSIPGMAYGGSLSWNPNIEKDFEKTYEAISLLEYGDESLKLISLLKELGNCQKVGWSELVRFKERPKERTEIFKLDIEEIKGNYEKGKDIEKTLTSLAKNIDKKDDVQDFIVSARGINLINEIFIILLSKNQNNKDEIKGNNEKDLAEKFELWLYDYSFIWRKRNKESELYRIRDVIRYIANYLRCI